MRANRFDGFCDACRVHVAAGAGALTGTPGRWRTWCVACSPKPPSRGQHDGWHRLPLASLDFETTGIDPHTEGNVSNLATHMREGTLNSLYRASNAILLGDRLAKKLGARVNSNLTLVSARGVTLTATVVGTFHSGFRMTDETTGYVLLRTAQTLEKQIGIINEIRGSGLPL